MIYWWQLDGSVAFPQSGGPPVEGSPGILMSPEEYAEQDASGKV